VLVLLPIIIKIKVTRLQIAETVNKIANKLVGFFFFFIINPSSYNHSDLLTKFNVQIYLFPLNINTHET
jgi:hypothetical protein